MNSRVEQPGSTSPVDIVKYALAVLLAIAGVFAFYWFDGQWPGPARMLAVVAGLIAAGLVFMTTAKGALTREFLSETRFELRKVVWPTRQEAVRMTWVVVIAVIVIALILAFYDMIIKWALRLFLG